MDKNEEQSEKPSTEVSETITVQTDNNMQNGAGVPEKTVTSSEKQTSYSQTPNYTRRENRGMGIFSKLILVVLFLILNGLFVLGAVDLILTNSKYFGGAIKDVQPVKVVEEESQTISVAQDASPAVVNVIATAEVPRYETQYNNFFNFQVPSQVQNGTEQQQIAAGSGFIVSSDGYVITNKHVVDDAGAKYTVILHDDKHKNEKVDATVVARDPNPNTDIAILKINETDLPFLNMGDSDNLKVGQTAIAIGYALGEFDNTVSKGVVSGLSRSITASGNQDGSETLKNLIQIDTAVNPGNSGGPLLDINGNVIGLNVAMADAQSIAFAIPINNVKADYNQVKSSGNIQKVATPFLGVRYQIIDDNVQKDNNLPYNYGAIITRGTGATDLAVVPGSPADKAGLVENDIILEVNGEKVTDGSLLSDLVGKYKPGDQIKLKIYDKGAEKEITVTLGQNQ